jgi:hypothetical protein
VRKRVRESEQGRGERESGCERMGRKRVEEADERGCERKRETVSGCEWKMMKREVVRG